MPCAPYAAACLADPHAKQSQIAMMRLARDLESFQSRVLPLPDKMAQHPQRVVPRNP